MRTFGLQIVRKVVALLCSAGAAVAMAQTPDWVVGQVAPLTGANATQARDYAAGMQLVFEQANKAGGVQGKPVRLVSVDDGGHAEETVAKTRKLLADAKPVVLAGYVGNRNLTALLDSKLLDQPPISLVGFQATDARVLQAPQLFSTRAVLPDEISKIASHLATVGIKRLALVYDERSDAEALTQMVTQAIAASGGKLVVNAMLRGGQGALEQAVDRLQRTEPKVQAVLVVAPSALTSSFIELYRIGGGTAQIYANSQADIEQLAKRLPVEYMSGLSIAKVVPNPYRVSVKLNKEFRDAVAASPQGKAGALPVSYAMMEGYINARVIVEAMRRTPPPLTREKLAAGLRSLDALDLGGYWINFRSGSQVGSRFVELSIVNASGRVAQ